MVAEQYERARKLLLDNAAKHNALADLLVEREVIFTEDVERIFGPRPWKSRADVLMEEEALKLAEERTRRLEAEAAAQASATDDTDGTDDAAADDTAPDNGGGSGVPEASPRS